MTYQIRTTQHRYGWTAVPQSFGGREILTTRWWWRPTRKWAFGCAERWCDRNHLKTHKHQNVHNHRPLT